MRNLCLGLLPLLVASTAGAAITRAPATIASGARVRVLLDQPGAKWQSGRLMTQTPDSLLLVSPNGLQRLIVADEAVARLQISRGWRSRAGIGALIGGAAGVGAVVALSAKLAGEGFDVDPGGATAASLLVGAGGASVGALIGSRISSERWVDMPRPWASLRGSEQRLGLEVRFAWSW